LGRAPLHVVGVAVAFAVAVVIVAVFVVDNVDIVVYVVVFGCDGP